MTRVERARLRLLIEDEPEVTLTQSVIAAALIVKHLVQDWALPVAGIIGFCIGALVVGIAMVL